MKYPFQILRKKSAYLRFSGQTWKIQIVTPRQKPGRLVPPGQKPANPGEKTGPKICENSRKCASEHLRTKKTGKNPWSVFLTRKFPWSDFQNQFFLLKTQMKQSQKRKYAYLKNPWSDMSLHGICTHIFGFSSHANCHMHMHCDLRRYFFFNRRFFWFVNSVFSICVDRPGPQYANFWGKNLRRRLHKLRIFSRIWGLTEIP